MEPINISTENESEDTVWIQPGRMYNIGTMIEALKNLKTIKEKDKKTKKNINPDIIFPDELERIIISSDKESSVDVKSRD